MSLGIVYFIQEVEQIGSARYKIGCSGSPTLTRLTTGYPQGSIYHMVFTVDKPFKVEARIKQAFNSAFTRLGETETYEGDFVNMQRLFLAIVIPDIVSDPRIPKASLLHRILNRFRSKVESPSEISSPILSQVAYDITFDRWLASFKTRIKNNPMEINGNEYRYQSKALYDDYCNTTVELSRINKNVFYTSLRNYCAINQDVKYTPKYKGYPAYDFKM